VATDVQHERTFGAGPAEQPRRQQGFWDKAVSWWALLGALLLVGQVWIFTRWLLSDDLKSIPAGDTPLPGLMKVTLVVSIAAAIMLAGWLMWRWVVKPWRRTGELTTLGAFGLGTWTMFWQDPLQNQIVPWFTWNSWMPNVGSWANQIPGIVQPNATALADPVYLTATGFVVFYFGSAIVGCWVMDKLRQRRPGIGTPWLILASIATCTLLLMVVELLWMRAGGYAYPSSIESLTFFSGHYYQVPIYEFVIDGIIGAAMAWVVYFRNDKGETVVERGIGDLKISKGKKNVMRVLAMAVAANLLFGMYSLTLQPFVHAGHEWPADIEKRSYFSGAWCGPGNVSYREVNMACYSDDLPVASKDGAFLTREGKVVPGNDPIPKPVPIMTTEK